MTTYYGDYNGREAQLPLAARIWGHRLRIGQHWIEYMLEFLSVMAGFEYRLGQGLPDHDGQPGYRSKYSLPPRLGLRRFVFYDKHEKTLDNRDSRAVRELRDQLRALLPNAGAVSGEDVMEQVRSLLRSFSAVEEERSWYAKTLFPVHEEFLLWEALRKGSTLRELSGTAEGMSLAALDDGVEFLARNFFARGGELYYLIISAGTEGRPEQRARIERRLRALLTEHNRGLGHIARKIDATWTQLLGGDPKRIEGTLGWILDPACALYQQMADDLDTFLDNSLDSLECLELLAHLIGFHIVCYIYHRAHPASDAEGHASGSCLEACRPSLLVDMLGEQDGGVVREQSAGLLREQDDLQLRQGRALVERHVRVWIDGAATDPELLHSRLVQDAERSFFIGQTKAKGKFSSEMRRAAEDLASAAPAPDQVVERYTEAIFESLSTEFRKNFLGVHRKIGRAIGLIAPRKGINIRFALGDTLLKTLTMAMLPPGREVAFGTFLEQLYARYGIVVGPGEARAAELMVRLRINEEYYARNRDALLARMQRAGLLTQYSDATALVKRR